MNQNEPRMGQLNRMPVPPFLQRPRGIDLLHKFLPDMVDIKADIKAYKKSPGGRPMSPGMRPMSPGGSPFALNDMKKDMNEYPGPFHQGNMRNPMGGSWKPPPRRPKFEQAPRGNNLGFGNEVQVLVNTHSFLYSVIHQVGTWIELILILEVPS